jgi:chemotaxis protein histidine kinase CheA|tara:strand:+ start:246 stop:1451 length:1206 start_codon:yes stop_codon:yes gene_type:complete
MNQPEAYILHCSISASVRQSVQIAFKDYKLPEDVIDTLRKANALSIRPNLSKAVKVALDELRLMQRYLYDRCTIHHGDVHFLHPDYFEEATQRIEDMRSRARQSNERIASVWREEFDEWASTVDNFFTPLIADADKLALVREEYLKTFPTKDEFKAPIQVSVVGPYPAQLHTVDDPADTAQRIANAAAINTASVLEAARKGSRDSSYAKVAELLDDLDARPASKVGNRVLSLNPKKRGAWQIAHTELVLTAKHNPLLAPMAELVGNLVECGKSMAFDPKGAKRLQNFERYTVIREEIRKEAKVLLSAADSTEGFKALEMSLSLTSNYQDLVESLDACESEADLDRIRGEVASQTSVFKHRAKKLERLLAQVSETITARAHLAEAAEKLEQTTVTSTQDCDF